MGACGGSAGAKVCGCAAADKRARGSGSGGGCFLAAENCRGGDFAVVGGGGCMPGAKLMQWVTRVGWGGNGAPARVGTQLGGGPGGGGGCRSKAADVATAMASTPAYICGCWGTTVGSTCKGCRGGGAGSDQSSAITCGDGGGGPTKSGGAPQVHSADSRAGAAASHGSSLPAAAQVIGWCEEESLPPFPERGWRPAAPQKVAGRAVHGSLVWAALWLLPAGGEVGAEAPTAAIAMELD
mmetsp:Transcript_20413/g.70706  ORF Transcript_20413/g.70706 Transcript_20413/m.70706 type:complete len:239 (+) Transcript_20413:368-1084(+)